ncbi:hypothetical protein D3C86_1342260 [compost metagenome]
MVGQPQANRNSLQLEINRKLYMDEVGLAPNAGFDKLKRDLNALMDDLLRFTRTA